MAKNYASIYNSSNVAISLEQKYFLKRETNRGVLAVPSGTDFVFTLAGGSVEFTQPFESSPHRSGRHHTDKIVKKKECSWSIPTYFNIDTAQVAPSSAEIDPAMRTLFQGALGSEDTATGLKYLPTTPDLTFSLFETGDKWARQVRGCFVESATLNFVGDGEATTEWSGSAKDAIYVGMGKTTADNNLGNTVTLSAGDGDQFKNSKDGYVMLIESDGVTRSDDTPDGSPRKIISVVGDVVELDGIALADSDASVNPIYLVYYEPQSATAINDPQTGLTGSVKIDSVGSVCARNVTITMGNENELINYCYGEDSLAAQMFVPANRFTAAVTMEINLDKELFALFQRLQTFETQDITVILGDIAGRHLEVQMPKAIFEVPAISVPESGSIPITFSGTAYQTTLDAGDEISLHFK